MELSRRSLIKLSATAILAGTALPFLQAFGNRGRNAVEVHFTGKHAFQKMLDQANHEGWAALPIGQLMGIIGIYLLNTPYVNYTLDHSPDREFCIVNLQALDCVTFVESTLALARMIKLQTLSEDDLAKQVELVRYRDGECDGFCSRLHYLSDWFYDNDKKGLIKAYTSDLTGCKKVEKQISLMSTRPNQYLQLRHHPELVTEIKKDEKAISSRPIYYLPKSEIEAAEPSMQTGDVIAITTSANILDCAHTGLCYRDDKGVLRFLHASLTHKKVYLDQELCDYVNSVHAFTGIMLARPLEPTS
jgi:hypothetical protein